MELIHNIGQFLAEAVIYLFVDASIILAVALFFDSRKQEKEAKNYGQADE